MKTKICKFILLAFSCICLSSCATIFSGSKKTIVFESDNVETADLIIDGRKIKNVTFPFTYKVRRGFEETIVTAEAEGYESNLVTIEKTFNPVSILNLFSILGWGIDAATGAMMKPEYNFYQLEFTPINSDKN